jgi:uncharacterized coiled-coil protein SlyX
MSIQEIREKLQDIQFSESVDKHSRPQIVLSEVLSLLDTLEAEQAEKDKQVEELKATVGNHQIVIDKLHIDEDAYLKQIEELTLERNGLMLTLAAANEKAEKLAKPVRDFLDIVNESRGIDGWHRNGDILLWEQCEQIAEIEDALASVQKPEEGKE